MSPQKQRDIGVGVGVGIGFPVMFALGLALGGLLMKRRRNDQLGAVAELHDDTTQGDKVPTTRVDQVEQVTSELAAGRRSAELP